MKALYRKIEGKYAQALSFRIYRNGLNMACRKKAIQKGKRTTRHILNKAFCE